MWIYITLKNYVTFISFLSAVDNLLNGVCTERMSYSVCCYLLGSR